VDEPRVIRVIRDSQESPDPRTSLLNTKARAAAERARLAALEATNARVLVSLPREPLMTADPASSSGVLIDESELVPELAAKINAGGGSAMEEDEVTLTFPTLLAAGVAVDIQTGAYPGGPAVVDGDVVTLPASGALFTNNGAIEVILNGQELTKGPGVGTQEAHWVSATQLRFTLPVFPTNQVVVRAPRP
jgi:hypothetical protein